MQESFLAGLLNEIRPLKEKLISHPVYNSITQPQHLHNLMRHHVFAVWDFMSLLKSLQRDLTCIDIPWTPKGDVETRFLINEIVCGEESDLCPDGRRMSHFELYLECMKQAGCSTVQIETLLNEIQDSKGLRRLMNGELGIPEAAQRFVNQTLQVALNEEPHIRAAVFTFGREDLIPAMFMPMVKEINNHFDKRFDWFVYYLERHIEVDGDHHSHLALQMTSNLCGDDPIKWLEATLAVCEALQARIALWDEIYACNKSEPMAASLA